MESIYLLSSVRSYFARACRIQLGGKRLHEVAKHYISHIALCRKGNDSILSVIDFGEFYLNLEHIKFLVIARDPEIPR
jgi:hypothetical protein